MPEYNEAAFRGGQVGAGISDILTGLAVGQQGKRRRKRQDFLEQLENLRLQREERAAGKAARQEAAGEQLGSFLEEIPELRRQGTPEEGLATMTEQARQGYLREVDPYKAAGELFPEPDIEKEEKSAKIGNQQKARKLLGDLQTVLQVESDEKGNLKPSGRFKAGQIINRLAEFDSEEASRQKRLLFPEEKKDESDYQKKLRFKVEAGIPETEAREMLGKEARGIKEEKPKRPEITLSSKELEEVAANEGETGAPFATRERIALVKKKERIASELSQMRSRSFVRPPSPIGVPAKTARIPKDEAGVRSVVNALKQGAKPEELFGSHDEMRDYFQAALKAGHLEGQSVYDAIYAKWIKSFRGKR